APTLATLTEARKFAPLTTRVTDRSSLCSRACDRLSSDDRWEALVVDESTVELKPRARDCSKPVETLTLPKNPLSFTPASASSPCEYLLMDSVLRVSLRPLVLDRLCETEEDTEDCTAWLVPDSSVYDDVTSTCSEYSSTMICGTGRSAMRGLRLLRKSSSRSLMPSPSVSSMIGDVIMATSSASDMPSSSLS